MPCPGGQKVDRHLLRLRPGQAAGLSHYRHHLLYRLFSSNFPYTPLVSVIVGVTNVIPFFGPFLGAIPSIFLILLDSPIQAPYFALFVLALQQLDGNVIGPLILGDKTGLSSLWVIMAILVGGSFFGAPGMFFGVPVFACFYSAAFFLDVRLRQKDLPLDTGSYTATLPKTNIEAPPREKNLESPCNEGVSCKYGLAGQFVRKITT